MIGEGISILDLTRLLTAIRTKDLVLQVKILDGEWKDFTKSVLTDMIEAILKGKIGDSSDIRARLYSRLKKD